MINGAFTVPGDGAVDFAPLLGMLRDHGYRGWLVVEAEQDPVVAPSYAYADKGYRHLAQLVARANGGSRMSLLVKARRSGREIVDVTPASAGWKYVGFAAYRLAAGAIRRFRDAQANELCVVVLEGTVTVARTAARRGAIIGERSSVFDDRAPYAVYVPTAQPLRITAQTTAEIGVASAPGPRHGRRA